METHASWTSVLPVMIYSVLYFIFVFAWAAVTHNTLAAIVAIVAVGVTYLFQNFQIVIPAEELGKPIHLGFWLLTIVLGAAAGTSLLV